MRASGFWALAALVVGGLIIGDMLTHQQGTQTAFQGATGLQSVVGNQLLGNPVKGA